MNRYIIERDLPSIGSASPTDLCNAASASNAALAHLAPKVQWSTAT